MRFLLQEKRKKELLILSLIYFVSQGMLLIASGRWWDDWCFYNQPYWVLKLMAMQLGRPTLIAIIKFANFLPEPGYRIITFLMIYFCMLFTYKVLKLWLGASDRACFWICALYSVIPANDSRIILAVFPYTIGLFFFMAGLSYIAGALFRDGLTFKRRVISWCLFLTSFILNSNLCFYVIVLLMILMKEKSLKRCLYYFDYVIIPIAFYAVKSYFFPVYGLYANYNTLTMGKLMNAIKLILPADFFILYNLMMTYISELKGYMVLLILGIILIILFCIFEREDLKLFIRRIFKKKQVVNDNGQGTSDVIAERDTHALASSKIEKTRILAIGFISLSLGLFSYVAVRQTWAISTVGLQGRDATLVAFGAAMLIYGFTDLFIKQWAQKYIFIVLIFSGIVFFNTYYLSYQQDYYRQLGFQYQLSQNEELRNAKNIVYINSDPGIINIQSFYSLNGNAEEVFGVQDKFIMRGFDDAQAYDADAFESFVTSGNYHMTEYDASYKKIDAVVVYSLNTTLLDTVKMKVYELIGSQRFDTWIQNRSSMDVYINGTKEYIALMRGYGYDELEVG